MAEVQTSYAFCDCGPRGSAKCKNLTPPKELKAQFTELIPLIRKSLLDPNTDKTKKELVLAAITSTLLLRGDEMTALLLQFFRVSSETNDRISCLNALAALSEKGSPEIYKVFMECLDEDQPDDLRSSCGATLSKLFVGDAKVAAEILKLLNASKADELKILYVTVLGILEVKTEPILTALTSILMDKITDLYDALVFTCLDCIDKLKISVKADITKLPSISKLLYQLFNGLTYADYRYTVMEILKKMGKPDDLKEDLKLWLKKEMDSVPADLFPTNEKPPNEKDTLKEILSLLTDNPESVNVE